MGSRATKLGALALSLLAIGAVGAGAVVTQKGNLRVKVSGTISPNTLPRTGAAPIAVSVAGQVSTVDQSFPPQLKVLKIEINRNGRLDYQGLPLCAAHEIQPATNERALSACRAALVGQGTFNAYIVLKGQEPYPASGRLLLFNGREGGHQVLLGHIYITQPFASSFLIPFQISANRHGQYGTTLTGGRNGGGPAPTSPPNGAARSRKPPSPPVRVGTARRPSPRSPPARSPRAAPTPSPPTSSPSGSRATLASPSSTPLSFQARNDLVR